MKAKPKPFDQKRALLLETLDGLSLDLANVSRRLDKNHAYLHQYIFRGKPRSLPERERKLLAMISGLSEDILGRPQLDESGDDTHIRSEQVAMGQYRLVAPAHDPSLIPMYAMAEGGEGTIATAWEVTSYTDRPRHLYGVKNAYGAYIVGDSMEPAFQRGNRVLVDPNIPPRADDDVLLFQDDIGQATTGLIKRMVKPSGNHWHVAQFNPPKKFDLDKTVWRYCHVVVARYPR